MLKDLTPRLLQQYYNYKAEQEGLAPKTIVNLNLFLHKALNYAVNEGYIPSNPAASINLPRGDKPQIEILTRDEQTRLMQGSYQHRYGVFVRLVLFTGLRLGELLGLRWEDIDFQSSILHVKRTLNRLNKVKRPTVQGESTTEIVIQTPKSQNSIRSVPLLPAVIADLQNWAVVQQQDQIKGESDYTPSGFVVTNATGGFIEPRTFKKYYEQVLELSGLRHFTFHALRHTFASRAMERGMDAKTLSMILGHYSVSFTLDTYTHVLDNHKHEGMALMDELFTPNIPQNDDIVYPVIITTQEDGSMQFEAAGITKIMYQSNDLQSGIQYVKDCLQEELLVSGCLPIPPRAEEILLSPNQMLLQLPIVN